MSNANPIATAPLDGSSIILFSIEESGTKYPRQASWWSQERCAAEHGGAPEDYWAAWYIDGTGDDEFCRPTHWIELPLIDAVGALPTEKNHG